MKRIARDERQPREFRMACLGERGFPSRRAEHSARHPAIVRGKPDESPLPDPFLTVFNEPAPDFSCERHEASTVTPQVFSLFNGQATQSRALALANRAVKETHSDSDAIARCFALAFSRPPGADELQTCLAHWRAMEAMLGDAKPTATKPPLEVKRKAVEKNAGGKFSFTEKLHANADFIPDLQPPDVPAHTRALADVCLALLNSNEFA